MRDLTVTGVQTCALPICQCRGWCWSRCRRGSCRTTSESQRHDVRSIESLDFSIDLKTQHNLRATEVLSLQNTTVFQFKCVRRRCTRHKQSERDHGQKTIPFAHCPLSLPEVAIGAISTFPIMPVPHSDSTALDGGEVA